jgi:hypothetical protein
MKDKNTWIILILIILEIILFKFLPYYFENKTIFNLPGSGLLLSIGMVFLIILIIIHLIFTILTIKNKKLHKFRIFILIIGWITLSILFFDNPLSDWNEKFKSKIIFKGNSGMIVIPHFEIILRENYKFEYQNNIPKSEKYYGTFNIKNDTILLNFKNNAINYGENIVYKKNGFAMFLSKKTSKQLPDTIYFNGNNDDLLNFINLSNQK